MDDYKPNPKNQSTRFDEDELIVDNLFFDAKNIFGLPADIRIGRQDFIGPTGYGEGLLILDGTPGDGSRSFYFNAAKAVIKFNQNNTLDLVYITDPKTDLYLPSLYAGAKKQLTASNEEGFVVYGRNKINDNLTIEPYYMYKKEDKFGATPELELNTLGARAVFKMDSWKLRGEFAHQFGEYEGGRDRTGNGGYVFIGKSFENVALKPEFDLGYVYLSGDDPNSKDKHEGWDPLFSRAPMWNELIIYTLINETVKDGGAIPGYWTNLNLIKASAKMNFTQNTNLSLSYQYLRASESTKGLSSKMFSNSGKEMGHLPTAMLNHKFSKNLDGYLQAEYFIPGNFYSNNTNNAIFLRWQLQFKI